MGATAAVLAAAIATALRWLASYRLLDRLLLVQLGANAVAAAAGLAVLASTAPPEDPLHVLYGAVAVALPTGVRLWAQGRTAATIGRWVAVAALVAAGATIRSFMTGG